MPTLFPDFHPAQFLATLAVVSGPFAGFATVALAIAFARLRAGRR